MKHFFLSVMVSGLLILIGCNAFGSGQKPGPVTDAKVLIGTWTTVGPGSTFYLAYDDDGTLRFSTMQENLAERPLNINEYWFEEGHYFERELTGSSLICEDKIGIYAVQLLENGHVKSTEVNDPCEHRAAYIAREYKRVE